MRFTTVIDHFIADMRAQGRLNSPASERGYRFALEAHAEDVDNRDPRYVGRQDVKRTLARWSHPNSQRKHRSVLVSFYDWLMEEGAVDTGGAEIRRSDNPARQTRRPRKRPPSVYRLTRQEVAAMLGAATGTRERRAIYLGICAGLRNAELRGLRGQHFRRPGFVHVSADIAKGGRERWVPVIAELEPVVAEITEHVAADEYVLPAQRWRDPGINRDREDKAKHPSSAQALYYLVKRVGVRAGIAAEVHPHLLRHAFGDHIARFTGIKTAQALMGHATVGTTEEYVGAPTLDELAEAVQGFSFGSDPRRRIERMFQGVDEQRASAGLDPTRLEPVGSLSRTAERFGRVLAEMRTWPGFIEAARERV